jgi:trk system potassium uptake protein TrkA
MAQRFLVVGLGRFGTAVAETLSQQGCEVVAVDLSMTNVEAVRDSVAHAVELDATDPEALRAIEASSCPIAVVAIGEDFEASVLSVAALKEVGVGHIIARANGPRERRILRLVGASEVVEIETDIGRRLAIDLSSQERRNSSQT